jgi:hypothetical protein
MDSLFREINSHCPEEDSNSEGLNVPPGWMDSYPGCKIFLPCGGIFFLSVYISPAWIDSCTKFNIFFTCG